VKVLKQSKREAQEQARGLLERFGLAAKADAFPDQLSGGQQQRAAIVRALAMDPELLLLDEITSALDPELVGEVLDILRDLKGSGLTMVMATHEISFARDVATRVVFLDGGVVHEQGPPEEILDHPQRGRTQRFLKRVDASGRL
jgi:polar amino acid transport system ATP-binding protein